MQGRVHLEVQHMLETRRRQGQAAARRGCALIQPASPARVAIDRDDRGVAVAFVDRVGRFVHDRLVRSVTAVTDLSGAEISAPSLGGRIAGPAVEGDQLGQGRHVRRPGAAVDGDAAGSSGNATAVVAQPSVRPALQVAVSIRESVASSKLATNRVCWCGSTVTENGAAPSATVGGRRPQPIMTRALQVLVSIIESDESPELAT